ncbi:TolC family protein [Altererythrobacter sp. TH136]|uniref:TolC family protein n=1 Tax=Altererythrobacter sp. TH136 TaxID=2067415 RepID=UPI0032C1586C
MGLALGATRYSSPSSRRARVSRPMTSSSRRRTPFRPHSRKAAVRDQSTEGPPVGGPSFFPQRTQGPEDGQSFGAWLIGRAGLTVQSGGTYGSTARSMDLREQSTMQTRPRTLIAISLRACLTLALGVEAVVVAQSPTKAEALRGDLMVDARYRLSSRVDLQANQTTSPPPQSESLSQSVDCPSEQRPSVSPPPPVTPTTMANGAVLPDRSPRPMTLDKANDPIFQATSRIAEPVGFRALVQRAVELHPQVKENEGYSEEARYLLRQQEAGLLPSAEINLSYFRVIDRNFESDSLDNILERTRATERADEVISVNQLVTDFGATANRIKAAANRLRAAALGVDNAAEQVALNTVAAWYDVYALRTVLAVTRAYRADQEQSRSAIAQRIEQGASAEVDGALVENAIAQLDIRNARFSQQLAEAEARFTELTGAPPPEGLMRAPELGRIPATVEGARAEAENVTASVAARFQARAAELDAKASRRDLLPSIGASVNAARYGVLESPREYDVVGRVTLRQRLFGGLPQRAAAAGARADAIAARARRVAEENARDAAIAFAKLKALDAQLVSLEAAYMATRATRDATLLRFANSRGTLFDAINASDTFYAAAAAYIEALTNRDTARYELLARTGNLLPALEISSYEIPR